MGFFSGIKTAGSYIFNFRVDKWVGYSQLKKTSLDIADITKATFSPEQAEHTETFEQALERLNLTQDELNQRLKEFTRLMVIYACAAFLIFAYSIWIVYAYKNIMGFFMAFALTVYALTLTFRYHFWIFQIKHRKLGCSLRDWFLDKR